MIQLDLRDYGDWPLSYRVATCVLSALLALGLPWVLLTRPTSAQWQALKSAEHALQTRLQQSRQQADTLPAFPSFTADEPAPPLPNLPALVTHIAETAHAAGLHGGQFRPASLPATDASEDGIPIELRLHGTWPQLRRFATDIAAPTSDAILSLRDIRLRVQSGTSALMLELSATVWIYPHSVADSIPVSAYQMSENSLRNPFIDSTIHSHQTRSHVVIGSLSNGGDHVGLVLTADGQLRRVHDRRNN